MDDQETDKDQLIQQLREQIALLQEENSRYKSYRTKGQKKYYDINKQRIREQQKEYYDKKKHSTSKESFS